MNVSTDEKSVSSAMASLGKRSHNAILSAGSLEHEALSQTCGDGDARTKIAKTGTNQTTRTSSFYNTTQSASNLNTAVTMNMNMNMNMNMTAENTVTGAIIPTPGMSVHVPLSMATPANVLNPNLIMAMQAPQQPQPVFATFTPAGVQSTRTVDENVPRELKPAPYFYYRDNSLCPDDDPLTPLTPLARVPNFPAKMQAILSRPDLRDVVTWMPHGRSWRVLKPREFEIRVIPTYFEHSKFSSFIRQANGWGFRRITRGKDRNSYYHELFLRGLPHLCKKMRRPTVSKKAEAEYEPGFYSISSEHPLPEKAETDYNILLPATLVGGPKARMPVGVGGVIMPSNIASAIYLSNSHRSLNLNGAHQQTNLVRLSRQQVAPEAPDAKLPHNPYTQVQQQLTPSNCAVSNPSRNGLAQVPASALSTPANSAVPTALAPLSSLHQHQHQQQQQPQQQQMQPQPQQQWHHQQQQPPQVHQQQMLSNYQANAFQQAMMAAAAAAMGNDPTSQFAAGFAAATALNNPQFQIAFNQALNDGSAHMTQSPCTSGESAANANTFVNYNEQNSNSQNP